MFTTVTLNPALDKLLETDQIHVGEINRTRMLSESPAGKGIDVAKVMRDLNQDVTATGFLGGPVAPVFRECFRVEKITDRFVKIAGSTRTNVQLFEKSGRRTEFLEKGPEVTRREYAELLETVRELAKKSTVVTLCGSVPVGIQEADFRELMRAAREGGAHLVTDTSGEMLRVAISEKPDLIKPNRSEMMELMGRENAADEEITAFARELVSQGVRNVLVSLGKDGAMLVCGQGVWRGAAPEVEVKSTLGCGDTMVASMSVSMEENLHPAEMLRRAIALSSANAMTFETAHILPGDYEAVLSRCSVEKIAE
jgi:1-phosphofructokinase family hexose kinase